MSFKKQELGEKNGFYIAFPIDIHFLIDINWKWTSISGFTLQLFSYYSIYYKEE